MTVFQSLIMAWKNHQNITVVGFMFFTIAFSQISINGFVEGGRGSSMKNVMLVKHGETKTIVSEDGDIIDCVDIYKQPAFSHPLLKNHTIQMRPSTPLAGTLEASSNDGELLQGWHKNGQCHEGTIPVVRTKSPPNRRVAIKKRLDQDDNSGPEYAQVSVEGGFYNGGHGKVTVWNPKTSNGEYSASDLWVAAGIDDDLNALDVGWQVTAPEKEARLYIYWTRDNYQTTGCYNLQCPGFVQTNRNIALGALIRPVSIYGGNLSEISLTIRKDLQSGHWWLNVQNQDVGYWPTTILTTLYGLSSVIVWGGEILNSRPNGKHTSTEMGSGHFPMEGFGKASLFYDLGYFDRDGALKVPEDSEIIPSASNYDCYTVQIAEDQKAIYGVHFYYGGPGFSANCP